MPAPASGVTEKDGQAHPEEGPDLVGTVLGERYLILRRLSAGGMGVVYQARHTVLNNLLAVKILLYAQDEEARARFLREAQIASQIQHPNTVFISDFGVLPDGRPYLVMEFLQGPTLRQVLERGALDPLRACQLAAQIARGLQTVHDKGIVHRDLKPENIFVLEQDGQKDFVKIVDFGLARADKSAPLSTTPTPINGVDAPALQQLELDTKSPPAQTMPGAVMGTPAYMSPEQVRGDEVDARADQYAFGCIVFEMLTGQVVYAGDNIMKLLSQHVAGPIPSLRDRAPQLKVPDELDLLVRRALAKQPEDRFTSMRKVEVAIEKQVDVFLRQRGLTRQGVSAPRQAVSLAEVRAVPAKPPKRPLWKWLLYIAPPAVLLVLFGTLIGVRYLRAPSVAKDPSAPRLPKARIIELRKKALTALTTDLGAADKVLRKGALEALGQTREVSLVTPLKQALGDSDVEVQAQAAEALGELGAGESRPELYAATQKSTEALVRVAAAAALDQLSDERGRSILRQFLRDKNLEARLRAAYWLCSPGEREAQELLVTQLHRAKMRDDIAVSLWYRLAQSGDANATQQLLGRLRTSTQRGLQLKIAADLAHLGEEQGRLFLREQTRRPGLEQVQAARALSELDEKGFVDLFRQLMRSVQGSLDMRIEAFAGIGASGQLDDMLLLEPELHDKAIPALRQTAAIALIKISDRDPDIIAQRSFQWAHTAAADERWFIREAAAAALGDLDGEDAVPNLRDLLASDQEARVRQRAARALGRRVEDEAVSALCKSLRDDDRGVRLESLRSLERVSKTLIESGAKSMLSRTAGCLKDVLSSGPLDEQIVARATLLRLGDASQREELQKLGSTGDAATRKLVVEQLDDDKEFLVRSLDDKELSVRFAAARRLAEQSDQRALPVLKSVLGRGGTDGIVAYGLLHKLGVDAPSPTDLESLLKSNDSAQRILTVEAIGRMPVELALPLLKLAARDEERLVRRLVGEVAADLKEDAQGRSGEPILRLLIADRDLSVRTRAAALLSRFLRAHAPRSEVKAEAKKELKSEAAAQPAQLDGGTATAAVPPTENDENADDAPKGKPSGPLDPAIDQMGKQGLSALSRKDVRQAQRLFDKAQTLCAKKQRDPAICGPLGTEFSYQLARSFESLEQWAEAMSEYQKVARASGPRRAKAEQRSAALESVVRLSPRLGRIVITKLVKGKCQQVEMWMPPGTQSLFIAGQPKQVKLAPRETATFEECVLKPGSKKK